MVTLWSRYGLFAAQVTADDLNMSDVRRSAVLLSLRSSGTSSVTRMRPTGPSVLAAHTRILAWTKQPEITRKQGKMQYEKLKGTHNVRKYEIQRQSRLHHSHGNYAAISASGCIQDFDASICASSRTSATKCNTVASQKTFSALLTFLAKTRENKLKPWAKSSVGGKGHRAAVRLMRCCVQQPSLTRNCVPCFVCCWRLHEFARKSAGA